MTALCHFPTPPAYAAQLRAEACRQEVVESAYAIICGASRHTAEAVTDACKRLKSWADATYQFEADLILEADAMLLALSLRAHRQRQDAARDDARRGAIRRELADYTGFVLICAAAVMILGWG